jgi:isopenicillin N synthase-like dioxygenase
MATVLHDTRHTPASSVIPVLDLSAYFANAPGALDTTAATLRAALEDIGFFILVNHGSSTAPLRKPDAFTTSHWPPKWPCA